MSSSRRAPPLADWQGDKSPNSDRTSPQPRRRQLPSSAPSSIPAVFLAVLLDVCKKIVFFNPYLRVAIYCACLFVVSSIADIVPVPKFFFNPFLNRYFVKLGWFWTLLASTPFVYMTSDVYCAGRPALRWRHYARLAVATFFWYFWVSVFAYVENATGQCPERKDLKTKGACAVAGLRWKGVDLSGHAFILIYSNLVLIEEARPIVGWEGIRAMIEREEHSRANELNAHLPLRTFTGAHFGGLRSAYETYLPYVRLNFVLIAALTVLWDYMLVGTILHFHSMAEKLSSGLIAMLVWYATYEILYKFYGLSPGQGTFVYAPSKVEKNSSSTRRQSLNR